jgi:hypothetical protein
VIQPASEEHKKSAMLAISSVLTNAPERRRGNNARAPFRKDPRRHLGLDERRAR